MNYDFYNPIFKIKHFLWEIFASHYLELIKPRVYNQEKKFTTEENESARYTLHFLLEGLLILLYPVIPQITSLIAEEKGIDLLKSEFPKYSKKKSDLKLIDKIMNFNSEIWKIKKDKGISLRGEINNVKIPKELKKFKKDLIAAHNLT